MPHTPETINYGDNAIFAFLQEATSPCFAPELLQRFLILAEFQSDHLDNQIFTRDSSGHAAQIEIHPYNGQQIFIDNIEAIHHSTRIKAGAQIGPYCIIGCKVTISEGVELEPGARVENGAVIERDVTTESGATFLIGSVTGERSIIRQGAEVGYDVTLPPETILKESSIATRNGISADSYDTTSR